MGWGGGGERGGGKWECGENEEGLGSGKGDIVV